MTKKFLLSLMILAFGILVFGMVTASAETSGAFTYQVVEGEAVITGFDNSTETAEIPAQIETYPVTAISWDAFRYAGIKSIAIPASVKSIDSEAFYTCNSLESISVDGNNPYFASLGGALFDKDMRSLLYLPYGKPDTSYVVPDTVTTIGSYAFGDNRNLTSITLGKGAKDIDASVFDDCIHLVSILVDADNQWYTSQDGILMSKDKTELVRYPAGKEETTYATPAGVTKIGAKAFQSGIRLESITLWEGVTSIGDSAFEDCDIERINLPDGLTSIGAKAFCYCTELTSDSVTLPDSLTTIGESAFSGCYGLTTITIPDRVTAIEDYTFLNCDGLKTVTIGDGVKSIGWWAFKQCVGLTDVTFGNNVESIHGNAFEGCTGLKRITLPDSVTEVDYEVFLDCTGLEEVVLGKGMTYIGGHMFNGCTSLTKVEIPDSVTTIQNYAFSGCTGITDVTIGCNVSEIRSSAFEGCTNLESVTIPGSVTTISDTVFYGCTKLTTVNYNGTQESWDDMWISFDNEPLENATKNYFWYVTYLDESGKLLQKDMVTHNTVTAPSTNLGEASAGIFFADEDFTTAFDFAAPITQNTTVYVKGSGTIASAPYSINSITIKDTAGKNLSAIPKDHFLATISITNINANGDNTVVLAQNTSQGVLAGLMYVGVEDMPKGATFKLTIPVDNTAGNVASLKAFVWESFGSAMTLGNAITFPAE